MVAEGWFVDPYGRHAARWISDGTPTALVRDGKTESHDPPPDAPYAGPLEPVAERPPTDGEDLRRADSAEAADGIVSPDALASGAWRAFDDRPGS
jgi:hypothetical protein